MSQNPNEGGYFTNLLTSNQHQYGEPQTLLLHRRKIKTLRRHTVRNHSIQMKFTVTNNMRFNKDSQINPNSITAIL